MGNNATISVISHKNTDEDRIDFITCGAFYKKNDSWYIIYDETEEMGMSNTHVMVKTNDKEVIVTRKGDYNSRMTYKKNVTTEFIYHMPYGVIPMVIDTKDVEFSFDENGGKLRMTYHLSVNEENEENILEILVKKDEE